VRPPAGSIPRAVVAAAIVTAAATYVSARAVFVPLTYDEAISVARFASGDLLNLVDFATAVNHQLNSAMLRVSTSLFGLAPWAVRLPNLLAGVAYCLCAAVLMAAVRHRSIGLAGLVLLVGQPYLLEFFALARGYGLAVALLTGAMLALTAWDAAAPGRRRDVFARWAAGLSATAVLANYSTLPAASAVWLVLALTRSVHQPGARRPEELSWPGWRAVAAGTAIAIGFNTVVFSRDRTLSAGDGVPVALTIAGLYEEEYSKVRVYRVAAPGRLRAVARGTGPIWPFGRVDEPWEQVRVVLPVEADQDLSLLDLTVGASRHRRDRRAGGPWAVHERDGSHVLLSRPTIRWRADGAQWRAAAAHAVLATGAVFLGGALGWVVLRRLVGLGLTDPGVARSVLVAAVATAAAAGAPLYLLRRDGQLFYGGIEGPIDDIVGSLVQATAHGVDETPLWWLTAGLGALIVAGTIVSTMRRGRPSATDRPLLLATALLALTAGHIVALHVFAAVPYPRGRTALAILPVALLAAVRAADSLADIGPWMRRAVTTAMVATALVVGFHAVRVAELTRTTDWGRDATAVAMLDLVAHRADQRHPAPDLVRVGVEWMYYPVVRYYADRRSTPARHYDIVVLPGDGLAVDYVYGSPGLAEANGAMIQRYPESLAGLWQTRP
jgi:hypothetical protein